MSHFVIKKVHTKVRRVKLYMLFKETFKSKPLLCNWNNFKHSVNQAKGRDIYNIKRN